VGPGSEIARNAVSLLGSPYRYGGADPAGFDCSGLVRYVHGELGIETPRTAIEQYRAARPVKIADLAVGDVLFFGIDSPQVSHVAIYVGERRFVHAPKTGRPVELRVLDDAYFRSRLAGVGQLF
jgi:cell wall-associated NlpC family hydrolase